jgi:hypothetical protein
MALYLLGGSMTLGGKVCSCLFIAGSLAVNIFFMAKPETGVKSFWITQAIIIGVFLIALLIIVALFKEEKTDSK